MREDVEKRRRLIDGEKGEIRTSNHKKGVRESTGETKADAFRVVEGRDNGL